MSNAFPTLPAIDLSPLFAGSNADHLSCGQAMLSAMQHSRGFVAAGLPFAADFDARVADALRFFDLPEDARMALATRRHRPGASHCYRGFFPLPKDRGWAHNEIFDVGPETPSRAPEGHPVKRFLEETNQWPAIAPDPAWRGGVESVFADLHDVGRRTMAALAAALGEDETTFMTAFSEGNGTLRLLHYPPPPEGFVAAHRETLPERVDAAGRRIITHSHVDACVLSLLWQDDVGGLQYEGSDGTWYEVPSGGGRISIHGGRALERMTGGRLPGTPHRVVGKGLDRCSMGWFLEPDFNATIGRDADGRAFTYADHMKDDFDGLDDYAAAMSDAIAAA